MQPSLGVEGGSGFISFVKKPILDTFMLDWVKFELEMHFCVVVNTRLETEKLYILP